MAGETVITVVGNLTADPELRFTAAGVAVANFTVASTPRTFNRSNGEWEDGQPLFLRCGLWRQPAENVAESLTKGARVIVTGRLRQRSFETKEGEKRTVVELEVDEVGPSAAVRDRHRQPAEPKRRNRRSTPTSRRSPTNRPTDAHRRRERQQGAPAAPRTDGGAP